MSWEAEREAKKAIAAGRYLQACYRKMASKINNPKIGAILHDLLIMEEMNETLLRSLSRSVKA